MRIDLTPAPSGRRGDGPSGSPYATPHKRIVVPSFDEDSSDSDMDLGSGARVTPTPSSGQKGDVRRLKNLLFDASAGEAREHEERMVDVGVRPFAWRLTGKPAAKGGGARAKGEGYGLETRAPVVKIRALPSVGVRACTASRGVAQWRAKGWRGFVGGADVGLCRGTSAVEIWGRGRLVERRQEIGALRIHIVAWLGGKADDSNVVPGLQECFNNGGGAVSDSVVASLWESVRGEAGGHGAVVFGLLKALYASGGEGAGEGGCLLRRVVLWACGEAEHFGGGHEHFGHGALGRCLKMLSVGDIAGAVKEAIGSGHLRLGMMVARAAESDKTSLRVDAADWLEACGGLGDEELEVESADGAVSVEERMILAVLTGNIREVAIRLRLNWYRLFAMELLYGAGSSSELQHSQRISSAVAALDGASGVIPPRPPHGVGSSERDAAYHLLRLYADPTASYPLTAGVFSSSSFGVVHDPCDARLPWLLHQTLSALVPRAILSGAILLSNAYASQLEAAGMPLWAFYVLCSGGPPAAVVKESLLRLWPSMCNDTIEIAEDMLGQNIDGIILEGLTDANDDERIDEEMGEDDFERIGAAVFLVHVLKVPLSWVHEAQALHCRTRGDKDAECEHWLRASTTSGLASAQALISDDLFPLAVAQYDAKTLTRLLARLVLIEGSSRPTNWSTCGGLILDYLRHVCPETMSTDTTPSSEGYTALMPIYRSMTQRVGALMDSSTTAMQRHSVSSIADGVVAVERVAALYNPALIGDAFEDLETLQNFVSLATARRVSEEYKEQTMDGGLAGAALFVSALPLYSSYIGHRRRSSVDRSRGSPSVEG